MAITRRIFVSLPADAWLTDQENALKWAIVERIESLGDGYLAEIFTVPRPGTIAGNLAWSAARADDVMRRCCGAALLGLPRWTFETSRGVTRLATEYCHYEGALARSMRLPLLTIRHTDVEPRVVFDTAFDGLVIPMPPEADAAWLSTRAFTDPFGAWKLDLDKRRDIFLGYCSAATSTARQVTKRLVAEGATVLDWQLDLLPGQSILDQIEQAAARCGAGVFLFTKDDDLGVAAQEVTSVPRDNVVFEAGFFTGLKGKDRVLIVRETGAKMPADLGGDIYAELKDRKKVGAIGPVLSRFVGGL